MIYNKHTMNRMEEGYSIGAYSPGKREVYEQIAQKLGITLTTEQVGEETLLLRIGPDDATKFPQFMKELFKASGGIEEYARANRPRHIGV